MKSICQALAFFLVMALAMCADGLMDTYGPTVFLVVGLVTCAAAYLLVAVSDAVERSRR